MSLLSAQADPCPYLKLCVKHWIFADFGLFSDGLLSLNKLSTFTCSWVLPHTEMGHPAVPCLYLSNFTLCFPEAYMIHFRSKLIRSPQILGTEEIWNPFQRWESQISAKEKNLVRVDGENWDRQIPPAPPPRVSGGDTLSFPVCKKAGCSLLPFFPQPQIPPIIKILRRLYPQVSPSPLNLLEEGPAWRVLSKYHRSKDTQQAGIWAVPSAELRSKKACQVIYQDQITSKFAPNEKQAEGARWASLWNWHCACSSLQRLRFVGCI